MDDFNKMYKIIYKTQNYDKNYYEHYEFDNKIFDFITHDITLKKLVSDRKGQKKFKKKLIKRYNNKCVISNIPIIVSEAAHIIPFSLCKTNNKYDVNNGLLLSANLHKLFDGYKMSINNYGYVVFSHDVLSDKSYIDVHKYNNKFIKLNNKTMKNLNVHYKIFLKNNGIYV